MTISIDPIIVKIIILVGVVGCVYFPIKLGIWLGSKPWEKWCYHIDK